MYQKRWIEEPEEASKIARDFLKEIRYKFDNVD